MSHGWGWGWGDWSDWNNWGNYSAGYLAFNVGNASAGTQEQTEADPFNAVTYGASPQTYSTYYGYYSSSYHTASSFTVSASGGVQANETLTLRPPSGYTLSGNQVVDASGNAVASFTGGAGADLVVTIVPAHQQNYGLVASLIDAVRYVNGSDTPPASRQLTLRVSESDGSDSFDSVVVSITPVNDAPVAAAAAGSLNEEGAYAGAVVAVDVDDAALTFAVVDASGQRVAAPEGVEFRADGSFSVAPIASDQGLDTGESREVSFLYVANDGEVDSAAARVTVTIEGVNDAPVVGAVTASLDEDGSHAGSVAATDVDDDAFNFAVVDAAGQRIAAPEGVTFNADGSFNVAPIASDQGLDTGESREVSFLYVANDGEVDSAAARVTVTIEGVNDAPVVGAVTASLDEDGSHAGSVAATDVDDDAFNFAVVDEAGQRIAAPEGVTFNGDGSFSVAPIASDQGLDTGESREVSFLYVANDGEVDSAAARVTVTIGGVNDAPVLAQALPDQSGFTGEGLSFGIPDGTFRDIDGETLAFSATLADGSALPAWLQFDASSGMFFGTPTGVEDLLEVSVTATDGTASARDTFAITVGRALSGGNGVDRREGGRGDDRMWGGNGGDVLNGAGGNDLIHGENGADVLLGGSGADVLVGGRGDDYLTGGAGVDTFVLQWSGGADTVSDFEVGADRLRLTDGLGVRGVSWVDTDSSGILDAQIALSSGSVTLLDTGVVSDLGQLFV